MNIVPDLTPSDLQRFWSKVEKTETCWNWTGTIISGGYGLFYIGRGSYVASRVAYKIANSALPEKLVVDHMCHNRKCVNPSHLRAITYKQNSENRAGTNSRNKSGELGVSWSPATNNWRARLTHNGIHYTLGTFDTVKEAGDAVRAKRLELYTHNDKDRAIIKTRHQILEEAMLALADEFNSEWNLHLATRIREAVAKANTSKLNREAA